MQPPFSGRGRGGRGWGWVLEKEENGEGGKKKSSEGEQQEGGRENGGAEMTAQETFPNKLWARLPSFFTPILIGSKHLRPSKCQHTR